MQTMAEVYVISKTIIAWQKPKLIKRTSSTYKLQSLTVSLHHCLAVLYPIKFVSRR